MTSRIFLAALLAAFLTGCGAVGPATPPSIFGAGVENGSDPAPDADDAASGGSESNADSGGKGKGKGKGKGDRGRAE